MPRGQIEAAQALGLHYGPRMLRVVLPQALRVAVRADGRVPGNLIKSTSLAAIIGFVEVTRAGQMLNNATFRPFLIFGIVSAIYFVLCFPLTVASRRLERRLALRDQTLKEGKPTMKRLFQLLAAVVLLAGLHRRVPPRRRRLTKSSAVARSISASWWTCRPTAS